MARAVQHATATTTRQLDREGRADRGNGSDTVAAAEQIGTHAAGCDPFALPLDQVGYGRDVDPTSISRIDHRAPNTRGWTERGWVGRLQRSVDQAACDRAGRQPQTRYERLPPRQPRPIGGRFESALEALAEGRVHARGTLPGSGQTCGSGDRSLFFGVPATQPKAAAPQEVGNDLVDAVLGLVHVSFTLAAARSARSCITLTAPTVEFISAATSFNEYPCKKRSSSTRR